MACNGTSDQDQACAVPSGQPASGIRSRAEQCRPEGSCGCASWIVWSDRGFDPLAKRKIANVKQSNSRKSQCDRNTYVGWTRFDGLLGRWCASRNIHVRLVTSAATEGRCRSGVNVAQANAFRALSLNACSKPIGALPGSGSAPRRKSPAAGRRSIPRSRRWRQPATGALSTPA